MTQATLGIESSAGGQVLYMALELSEKRWGVLFASGGGKRRERSVGARDVGRLLEEVGDAKRRLGLRAEARVVSCYEAGRDGFWLDRALRAKGIESLVVDSSSIEVPRRARRRKTDRLDLGRLMALLQRYVGGERKVWSVVRVPEENAEDVRQLSRSIERLKAERGRHVTRIKALLATQGLKLIGIGGRDWAKRVAALRRWDGSALGRWLQRDLCLEGERLALAQQQLAELKAEREALVAAGREAVASKARALARLGAIAAESSFVFATELFGWRRFANRREQGLSKAGNRRMRTMLVEIAWCWLRYQPHSTLSVWWQRRFAHSGGRARKVAIVALARKLLVALWRYLEHSIVPEGATLKPRVA